MEVVKSDLYFLPEMSNFSVNFLPLNYFSKNGNWETSKENKKFGSSSYSLGSGSVKTKIISFRIKSKFSFPAF
jgi:hypothetical protein